MPKQELCLTHPWELFLPVSLECIWGLLGTGWDDDQHLSFWRQWPLFSPLWQEQVLPHDRKVSWVSLACVVVPHLFLVSLQSWEGLEGADEVEALR